MAEGAEESLRKKWSRAVELRNAPTRWETNRRAKEVLADVRESRDTIIKSYGRIVGNIAFIIAAESALALIAPTPALLVLPIGISVLAAAAMGRSALKYWQVRKFVHKSAHAVREIRRTRIQELKRDGVAN